jgi:hypothetical protein
VTSAIAAGIVVGQRRLLCATRLRDLGAPSSAAGGPPSPPRRRDGIGLPRPRRDRRDRPASPGVRSGAFGGGALGLGPRLGGRADPPGLTFTRPSKMASRFLV